jgi:hypothetical protein
VGIESQDHGKFPAQKFYTGHSAMVPHLMAAENSRQDSAPIGIMKHANMHFMTAIKGLVALAEALAPRTPYTSTSIRTAMGALQMAGTAMLLAGICLARLLVSPAPGVGPARERIAD